jgi:hypothetical protein
MSALAPEPIATTARPRQRWLLIGPPVVLLIGKGLNQLIQLGLTDTPPDRIWLVVGLAVLSIVAALALLSGSGLGWVLAMAVIGADLLGELVLWWIGSPHYVSMALLTLCAILVTSPDMRAAHIRLRVRP